MWTCHTQYNLKKSINDSGFGLSATRFPTKRSGIGEVGVQKIDLVRKVVNRLRDQIIAMQFEPNGSMPPKGTINDGSD